MVIIELWLAALLCEGVDEHAEGDGGELALRVQQASVPAWGR